LTQAQVTRLAFDESASGLLQGPWTVPLAPCSSDLQMRLHLDAALLGESRWESREQSGQVHEQAAAVAAGGVEAGKQRRNEILEADGSCSSAISGNVGRLLLHVAAAPGCHAGPSSSPTPWPAASLVSRSAANNNSSQLQRVWEHSNLHLYACVLHRTSWCSPPYIGLVPLCHCAPVPLRNAWSRNPECPHAASLPIPDDMLALPPRCI